MLAHQAEAAVRMKGLGLCGVTSISATIGATILISRYSPLATLPDLFYSEFHFVIWLFETSSDARRFKRSKFFQTQRRRVQRDAESFGLSSSLAKGLPISQTVRNQLSALLIVASIKDAHVLRIGAHIDAGRACVHLHFSARMSREVS